MDLDPDRPRRDQRDIDYARWVLDAKVRTLSALVALHTSGKGDEGNRAAIGILAEQISSLPIDGQADTNDHLEQTGGRAATGSIR